MNGRRNVDALSKKRITSIIILAIPIILLQVWIQSHGDVRSKGVIQHRRKQHKWLTGMLTRNGWNQMGTDLLRRHLAHLHVLRVQINSLHGSLREQRRLLKTGNIYDGNIYDRNANDENANDENTNDENANDRNANDENANDENANDVSTIG
jgi:hypothetical protein